MIKNRRDILKRHDLKEVIPLSTPFRLGIEVSTYCNFKCSFCFHSLSDKTLKSRGFKPEMMSVEMFESIVDQLCGFNEKIKHINLSAIGEPLTHPHIAEMISRLKKENVTDVIAMTTNAYFLNNKMSNAILEAGIDEVIVSVEGLSGAEYKDVCGVHIDFDRFFDNLKYHYQNKGDSKLYIKTVDVSVKDGADMFYDMFSPISDLAYVENIIELFASVEYGKIKSDFTKGLSNSVTPHKAIYACPLIFYSMQVMPNGNVIPCCVDYGQSVIYGNVNEQSIVDIWRGDTLREFQIAHLERKRWDYNVCSGCSHVTHNVKAEDIIDSASEELKKRIEWKVKE